MHNEPYVRTAKLVSPLKETTRPDCEYLLSPVAVSGFAYDIMIFTYDNSYLSEIVRDDYYSRCGFASVELTNDKLGVLVSSEDGLKAYAYEEELIKSWIYELDHNYDVVCTHFYPFGLMVYATIGN